MFSIGAIPTERGCSRRIKGGVYLECGTSPWGQPVEYFLVDPPIPVDLKLLGVSSQGVRLFEREGVWYVLDWVGQTGYPNVTDDIEEIRRFGMSARAELSEDEYAKLSKESRVLRIHAKAWIEENDRIAMWTHRIGMGRFTSYDWELCPKNIEGHNDAMNYDKGEPTMCAGLWWEDVAGAVPIDENTRVAVRTMPSFKYDCVAALPRVMDYRPAIYASFPISRIVVVADPDAGTHDKKLAILDKCVFPVALVEE